MKERLGELLHRLVPGFNGYVLAYKNHEIIWNDSRPQPTEQELQAEYQVLLQEEAQKNQARQTRRAALKKIRNINNLAQVKVALEQIVEETLDIKQS